MKLFRFSNLAGTGALVFFLSAQGCLTSGCNSPGPKTFDEQLAYIKALDEFSRQQGIAYTVQLHFDGKVGVYQSADFGINSGAALQATLIGNPGGSRTTGP